MGVVRYCFRGEMKFYPNLLKFRSIWPTSRKEDSIQFGYILRITLLRELQRMDLRFLHKGKQKHRLTVLIIRTKKYL